MSFRGAADREEVKPRIHAWSFSRWKTWHQCPFKLKCSAIDKLKEPETEAQLDGKRIHKLAEDYLNDEIEDLPNELAFFAQDYQGLRDYKRENPGLVFAEMKVTLREDLTLCEWNDWGAAWLRAAFDAAVINEEEKYAVIVDLKTGKQRQEDNLQLSLFALIVFIVYPTIEEVSTELWYAKDGGLVKRMFYRSQFAALQEEWAKKINPMLADDQFLPTPNGLCKWCHYRKSNGGPCQFA